MDEIDRIERRLKLHEVRVLIAVVEAGSMHKAAERLRISQPVISRAIADLEHAVGVRLLERSPRGIEPTQYGRVLVKRGVAGFDEFRQGVKDIRFLADPSTGELRIGCTDAMAAGPVVAVIEKLSRQHPGLIFHLVTGAIATLYRALAERNVELVITGAAGATAEEYADVQGLFEDNVVVVAGAQSRWARRRRIELDELVKEPWTLPPHDSAMGAIVAQAFRTRGLPPPTPTVVAESFKVRKRLLATGRFLTVYADYALKLDRDLSLRTLPVELPGARRVHKIVGLKSRSLSPLAELFVDRLRALANTLAKGK